MTAPTFMLNLRVTPKRIQHLALMMLVALPVWAASTSSGIASSPNRLQKVMAAGELRVCIWPDYYGITYRNPKTRELRGIDIDTSMALGNELGVKIRYVDSSFPALAENLLQDRCDIAMHAVGITASRQALLSFTNPYLRSDIYAVTSTNFSSIKTWADLDQPGKVIAVQDGTIMEPVMRQSLKYARLMVVKPPMRREVEVESGRADAFMTDYPYSKRMLDTTSWASILVPTQPFHMSDYAYALAPGDDSLLQRVNSFMEKIRRDGRLHAFAKKYGLETILIQNAYNHRRANSRENE